ncbi:hypothetical protein GGF40_002366 [Coemansia sp. RSA 1286]|nr:hypothetical protein GGF40_002366 [Coemansia sp. RSA 1286]
MSAFYIEILDSLQVVDIYAKQSEQSGPALQTDSVVYVDKRTSVELPVSVNVGLATKTQLEPIKPACDSSGWVRLRAPISSASRKSRLEKTPQLITSIRRSVTANSLQGLADICCRMCGAQLVSEAFTRRSDSPSIRDLPSAYWIELVDCWVCHPEEDDLNVNKELLFAFESDKTTRTQKRPSAILDSAGSANVDVWVGDTFALVSADLINDLPTRLVHIEDKTRFDNAYTELKCAGCDHVIGESGRMGPRRMQKLYLHCIDLQVSDKSSEPVSIGFSQAFCSEVLGHVSAHAVYKFVIEERQSCKPVALIHVVGWNSELHALRLLEKSVSKPETTTKTTTLSEHSDGTTTGSASTATQTTTTKTVTTTYTSLMSYKKPFCKYVKVLFVKAGDDAFDKMSSEWISSDSTELISLLEEDCRTLFKELDLHSTLLPPQLRTMGEMKRSFLRM